jgi:hypothetical protein
VDRERTHLLIDRQHGRIVIECDACEATFEADSDEWAEVWASAKRDGWHARKLQSIWLHECPDCRDS